MQIIKMSSMGLSHTVQYGDNETRAALLSCVQCLGFKSTLILLHGVKTKEITLRIQIRFICSFAGVQGYPVTCFINWLNEVCNVQLLERNIPEYE